MPDTRPRSSRFVGYLAAGVVLVITLAVTFGWLVYMNGLLRALSADEVHIFQFGLLLALAAMVAAFLDPIAAAVLVALEVAGVVGVFLGLSPNAYTVGVAAIGVLALVTALFWRRRTGLVLGAAALVAVGLGLLLL